MRPIKTRHVLLCLALAAACGHASAAESRHANSTEAPAPTEPAPSNNDRFEDADIDGAVATMHAQRATQKPRTQSSAPAQHTSGDSRALPARFHSFLPGMFR